MEPVTRSDHRDVGALIACALQPTLRPGRSTEYRRLLGRYRTEEMFRAATDDVLGGLGARVLSDNDFGLVVGVEEESPFAFHLVDLPRVQTREDRLLFGLCLVVVAAWSYPSADDLDGEVVPAVATRELETWTRSACEALRVKDAAGEVIPDEGLDAAWRVYADLPALALAQRGRTFGRPLKGCSTYWVDSVLDWLASQGMAIADGPDHWRMTERFRVMVRDMAGEPAYEMLAAIARTRVAGGSTREEAR